MVMPNTNNDYHLRKQKTKKNHEDGKQSLQL